MVYRMDAAQPRYIDERILEEEPVCNCLDIELKLMLNVKCLEASEPRQFKLDSLKRARISCFTVAFEATYWISSFDL